MDSLTNYMKWAFAVLGIPSGVYFILHPSSNWSYLWAAWFIFGGAFCVFIVVTERKLKD